MGTHAELVFSTALDDKMTPRIPPAMGTAAAEQAHGPSREVLAEIAGRVCYDSFGRGRNSEEYHKHIIEVGHLSVYEHCTFTVEFDWWPAVWSEVLLNRPGVFFSRFGQGSAARVTTNLRAILEWDCHKRPNPNSRSVGDTLQRLASEVAPSIIPPVARTLATLSAKRVVPQNKDEAWVSLWLRGSRGFSHEMVRHGDSTAISQRSTRYVHEGKSEMLWHPALLEWAEKDSTAHMDLQDFDRVAEEAREVYSRMVGRLVESCGLDRKTARGAARGVLPHALETQMIFSASIRQWENIFRQRCSPHADGEIRQIMEEAREIVAGEADVYGGLVE